MKVDKVKREWDPKGIRLRHYDEPKFAKSVATYGNKVLIGTCRGPIEESDKTGLGRCSAITTNQSECEASPGCEWYLDLCRSTCSNVGAQFLPNEECSVIDVPEWAAQGANAVFLNDLQSQTEVKYGITQPEWYDSYGFGCAVAMHDDFFIVGAPHSEVVYVIRVSTG